MYINDERSIYIINSIYIDNIYYFDTIKSRRKEVMMSKDFEFPRDPKKVCKLLEKNGWKLDHSSGSHRMYVHPTIKDKIPVPYHPGKDIPIGTLKQIFRRAGIK